MDESVPVRSASMALDGDRGRLARLERREVGLREGRGHLHRSRLELDGIATRRRGPDHEVDAGDDAIGGRRDGGAVSGSLRRWRAPAVRWRPPPGRRRGSRHRPVRWPCRGCAARPSRASWADATFCFGIAVGRGDLVLGRGQAAFRVPHRPSVCAQDSRSRRRRPSSRDSWSSASLTALRAWVRDSLLDALVSFWLRLASSSDIWALVSADSAAARSSAVGFAWSSASCGLRLVQVGLRLLQRPAWRPSCRPWPGPCPWSPGRRVPTFTAVTVQVPLDDAPELVGARRR